MTMRSWVRRLFPRPADRPLRKVPPRVRPGVEALEDRLVPSGLPRPDHVVIVIEENKKDVAIYGNTDAPYINSLANSGAKMTNSFAIEHPSQPNYLDLFSGSNQGVSAATAINGANGDSRPSSTNFSTSANLPFTTPNLGASLRAAALTFTGYSESLPYPGWDGDGTTSIDGKNEYARKHNPWANWVNNPVGTNQLPASVNQPFTSFPTDYSQLPTVSIVVPNEQNDMHDGTIAQGDSWLQTHLGGYAQWAKTNNSLLIVDWDENDVNPPVPNQIATIFYGAMVQTGQYAEAPNGITHYNVLRTIEDMYGLPPCGSPLNPSDASATAITDIWQASYNYRAVSETVNADGNTRILWTKTDGSASLWDVNAATGQVISNSGYGPYAGYTTLRIASATDGSQRLLWQGPGGQASIWTLDAAGNFVSAYNSGIFAGWRPLDISVGSDGNTRLLWQKDDGSASVWNVNTSTNTFVSSINYTVTGWTATHLVAAADGYTRLQWNSPSGQASVWLLNALGQYQTSTFFAGFAGWTVTDITVTSDGATHALWTYLDGRAQIWSFYPGLNQAPATLPVIGPVAGWTARHLTAAGTGYRLLWDYVGGTESLFSLDANGTITNNVGYGPF